MDSVSSSSTRITTQCRTVPLRVSSLYNTEFYIREHLRYAELEQMKSISTLIINTLIALIVLVLIVIALENYLLPNRGLGGKDLHEIALSIAKKNKLEYNVINGSELINPDDIDIPMVQSIKTSYRKALSVIGLTKYGVESGVSLKLTLKSRKGYIKFKGFCVNDQLIGVEIDYTNIESQRLNVLKTEINKVFYNYSYEVTWTEL